MQLHNKVNRDVLRQRINSSLEPRTTISFYQYYNLQNPIVFRDHLYQRFSEIDVLGRIYVSKEGINAQVSLPEASIASFRRELDQITFLKGVRLNFAIEDNGKSFFKLTIKVRDKIVADGLDDASFDVTKRGKHLSASEVNDLLDQKDTLIVDMRNHYESEVGHFQNAICPDVETFREELPVVEEILSPHKDKNIILYCTGGIRCEKASAYYLHKGFEKIHMIDGGIIEYSRQCKEQGLQNKFVGKNFVFDERLGERISEDVIASCHQCGRQNDTHTNCANNACHILFIQCPECSDKYKGCCSRECTDFLELPPEEQEKQRAHRIFNGTRFGKGRSQKLQS